MGDFSRKADGRRVFTSEFKRTTVEWDPKWRVDRR